MPSYSYSRTTTTYGPGGQKTVKTTRGGAPLECGGKGVLDQYTKSKPNITQKIRGKHDHDSPKTVSTGGRSSKLTGRKFDEIKAECLSNGSLFEDPDFPAVDSSLFFSQRPPRPFEWKRPQEFCDNPKLFVGGGSRFDVMQGELGDCWLLAAIASLASSEKLLAKVVPSGNQSFRDGDYSGIFHFEFYQYGEWVEVVVDDRLPTYNNRLVFMHSSESNEFWSALLEKAYAKLHGSYEALKGGNTCEAMEDFTGGVTEMFDLTKSNPNVFKIMTKALERNSLMGCSIEPDPNVVEAVCDNGLIKGHAYSVTNAKVVDIKTPRTSGKIPLVRVRNPWGNEAEWKGAWSDKSPEWQFIDEATKQSLGLTFDHDGEFWMSFKDFAANFSKLEICNLSPDALGDDSDDGLKWGMSMFDGSWSRGCTAGGCRNFLESFWTNPQYFITLQDPDDDDDDDKCTCIVGLMQKHRRKQRQQGLDHLTIGFALYSIKPEQKNQPLPIDFFKYNASVGRSAAFINLREVNNRFKLPPGSYVIIPSTFEPQQTGEFLVRVFTEKAADAGEVDEETDIDTSAKSGADGDAAKVPQPTPQDEKQADSIKEFFAKISGEDLEVDCYELKQILDFALKKVFEFDFPGFSIETCRSMVAMMDEDRSGKLGLDEFKELWTNIRVWKNVFKQFDKDKSGSMNTIELRNALHCAGYKLSSRVFKALVLRYGDKSGNIQFNDFIMCAVKLKAMIEKYKQLQEAGLNSEAMDLDDWVETTMYS